MTISRSEFDRLPVVVDRDDTSGSVGLYRKELRSWWVIIRANPNGTGVFYRPEMTGGESPLH